MLRTAWAAVSAALVVAVITASGTQLGTRVELAGAHAPETAPPHDDTAAQRLQTARPLMRQVPAQRVAGLTEHVDPSCSGTGQDGDRVQVLYVRASGGPSQFAVARAAILDEVRTVDDVFAASAAKTGGGLRVRWVHGSACEPSIEEVAVSQAAIADGWDVMHRELRSLGFDRSDRKYLVFTTSRRNCGLSDGNVPASISRIDAACWPMRGTAIAAHELGHALGAVASDAPHYSGWGHCNEAADLMCNGEHSSDDPELRHCPAWQRNWFDCGDDDYFSMDPAPGSYLDSSRNIARSPYLDTVPALPPAPSVRVTASSAPEPQADAPGQVVTVRAVTGQPVTGWSFPTIAGSCRLEGAPEVTPERGSASYTCVQARGSSASITVQALGSDGRVGYGSGTTVVRAAPVRFEFSQEPRAGRAFTLTAVAGGGRHTLWSWSGGGACRLTARGPVADLNCPARMAGRSITISVLAFLPYGTRVSLQREVRLAG